MSRSWLPPVTLGLALLLVCPVGAQAGQRGEQPGGRLSAVLVAANGTETALPLIDVAGYHCHDFARPVFRCFSTDAARDEDVSTYASAAVTGPLGLSLSGSVPLPLGATSVTYVICYVHANYGGSSLYLSNPIADLAPIGWNDQISSLKSTNGGHPKFWPDAYYSGTPVSQWVVSAWVPYVGDNVNDTFSSIQNVP